MADEEGAIAKTGRGLTETAILVLHPVGNVYVIPEVPSSIPATDPEVLIVATAVLELVHVPPDELEDNEVVPSTQTEAVPEIAAGAELTVATVV